MSASYLLPLGGLLVLVAGCAAGADAPATADEANVTGEKILLDCNVFESGGGPDQQATVVKRSTGLVLKELTNTGSMVERPLTQAEWNKQDLTLRLDRYDGPETKNRLFKKDGDWQNESVGGGFSSYGYADCFKDTTR